MNNLVIRDFEDRDVAAANALTNHFIQHTAIHFGFHPVPDQRFRDHWLDGRRRFPWLAAEADGRFLGYSKAALWRDRDAYRATAEAGIYVVPDAQRRGVGRALYTALFDRLRSLGFRTVIGGITLPNEASVRLHEALGFTPVGVFRRVGHKFDAWHDVGFWQLDLHTDPAVPLPPIPTAPLAPPGPRESPPQAEAPP